MLNFWGLKTRAPSHLDPLVEIEKWSHSKPLNLILFSSVWNQIEQQEIYVACGECLLIDFSDWIDWNFHKVQSTDFVLKL